MGFRWLVRFGALYLVRAQALHAVWLPLMPLFFHAVGIFVCRTWVGSLRESVEYHRDSCHNQLLCISIIRLVPKIVCRTCYEFVICATLHGAYIFPRAIYAAHRRSHILDTRDSYVCFALTL